MREAIFLAIAMLAFVGAAFVPGGAIDSATEGAEDFASEKTADPTALDRHSNSSASYASWAAGATELPRAADGHFYAETRINGSQVEFLVDTGATKVALTGTDARAAGLYWSDADVREVAALIVPEGLGVSLLGQSFLSTIHPVRIEHDRMVLGE